MARLHNKGLRSRLDREAASRTDAAHHRQIDALMSSESDDAIAHDAPVIF